MPSYSALSNRYSSTQTPPLTTQTSPLPKPQGTPNPRTQRAQNICSPHSTHVGDKKNSVCARYDQVLFPNNSLGACWTRHVFTMPTIGTWTLRVPWIYEFSRSAGGGRLSWVGGFQISYAAVRAGVPRDTGSNQAARGANSFRGQPYDTRVTFWFTPVYLADCDSWNDSSHRPWLCSRLIPSINPQMERIIELRYTFSMVERSRFDSANKN